MGVDLRVDPGDRLVEGVNLPEVQMQQEAMVRGHAPPQRLAQGLGRGFDPPMGQLRQPGGVGLADDQGLDHGPPAQPGDVGNRRSRA